MWLRYLCFHVISDMSFRGYVKSLTTVHLCYDVCVFFFSFPPAILKFRWDEAYELLEEMKTNRVSSTHQVIASLIKGEYDDESNWQMVEYVFDNYNAEGCGFGLRFYNALLEALWWLGQRARASRVLHEAVRRGLFPELYRQSKLVWSANVHR